MGKAKKKVLGGETIVINTEIKKEMYCKAQNIPLNIIYEDEDILIVNKQRNLVIHPGAGNPDGTMLNALINYYPSIINVPRAGIVHRLDKDTTGLIIVGKSILAQKRLIKSLQLREIIREYEAIVVGRVISEGVIDKPIKRHPIKRTHMFVHPMGKPAVTDYRIIESFHNYTRLRLRLKTGRTHQIRVHMAHINHPLVGDQMYGRRLHLSKDAPKSLITALSQFDRQALHAVMIRLYHPITGIEMEWSAPIPQDMINLIKVIRNTFEKH